MNCMFFNARSITHKTQEINLFTKANEIDLAIIAESRLQANQTSPFHNTIVNIPAKTHLGGILAFSPSGKLTQTHLIKSDKNWQILQTDDLIIGFGYFAPSEPFTDIESFFESLEEYSNVWQEDVIIVADFNARHSISTGDHASNERGPKFFELIGKYPLNLENTIQGFYTTNTSTGKGRTDLLFSAVGNKHTISDFIVHEDNLNGSDHWPLTWSIDIQLKEFTPMWNFKLLRSDEQLQIQYAQELEIHSRHLVEQIESKLVEMLIQRQTNASFEEQQAIVDSIWNDIILWIESALAKTCKKRKLRTVNDIFWTPDLKKQKEERKTNKSYSLYKRYCKNLQKREKELYLELIEDKSGASKRGDLFKLIKYSNRKKKTCFLNSKEMINHANHFLKTFGGNPQGDERHIDAQVLVDSDPKVAINCYSSDEIFFLEASYEEVDKAISKTACGKASGADLMGAEAYKFGGVAIRSVLSSFYTLCGKMQITPSAWRESIIIPIYKNKGEKTDIANYRPIALTIVAKRIFEKLIDSKLGEFKRKLQSSQGGFLKKRSTLHQVYFILELMRKNPDLIQIFLDLSAAYDMVDRRILWSLLKNHFGMPTSLIRLLRSLFDENYSRLNILGEKSEKIQHLRGLPQGSSLSPILFNFFIDSLIRKIQKQNLMMDFSGIKTNNLFFADDGNIHSNKAETVQEILDLAYEWESEFGMKFSPSKCLVLSKRKNLVLNIGGIVLPQVEEAVYLGIPLSATGFNSKSFAKSCARKMEASIMQIVKGGYSNKYWSPGIKLGVYKQFIRPTAEYGLQLKIMDTSVLDVLEATQLKASRILLQLPWNCSIQAIRRLFCLESMQCRNKILNAKFFRSIESLQDYDQITKLVQNTSTESKSLYRECLRLNECIRDFKATSNQSELRNKIKDIRRSDILDPKKGCKSSTKSSTRISDSIPVSKSLKLTSILFWETEEEGEMQRKLVRWRLGRIAFHQECVNCNKESLSRKHATLCSGIDQVLFDKYQEIESFFSQNILDTLLNKYMFGSHISIWKDIAWAITQIQTLCLGFTN
jgi:hypothetical protein